MKKTRKLVLAGILAVSMLTACAPGEKEAVDYSVQKDDYIYTCPAPDDSNMNDTQKEEYQSVLKMLPHIHDSITLTVQETANMGSFPAFFTTGCEYLFGVCRN